MSGQFCTAQLTLSEIFCFLIILRAVEHVTLWVRCQANFNAKTPY